MIVDLFNDADTDAYIIATHFEWEPESPSSYIDWFRLNWTSHNYDQGNYASSPVDASYGYPGSHPEYRLLQANTNDTRLRTRVQNQSLDPPVGDWLISLTFYYPTADLTCTITSSMSVPTPTPTASATPTPPCTLDGDGLLGVYYDPAGPRSPNVRSGVEGDIRRLRLVQRRSLRSSGHAERQLHRPMDRRHPARGRRDVELLPLVR